MLHSVCSSHTVVLQTSMLTNNAAQDKHVHHVLLTIILFISGIDDPCPPTSLSASYEIERIDDTK